jgi:MarR family transcriptional regulator, 2-MHQ and catechol-resistance regulon repressor
MPTHYQGSPQEVLALDTFIKFTRASNTFEGRLFQLDLLEGLTQSQFGVLEILYHLGSMCQGEVSAKLLKSTGNITLVLDNLEKQGLVRRERQPDDRRSVTIHLTPAGEVKIRRIFPRMAEAITAELSVLTPEEQQTLGSLCRILGKRTRL